MRFNADSDLFGHEKDDSFKGSIGNIYQSFGGEDIYPTLEEKAANLLYFVTKNHSFSDRNKRIAATIFLYFLDKNGILYNENGNLAKDLNKKIVEKNIFLKFATNALSSRMKVQSLISMMPM